MRLNFDFKFYNYFFIISCSPKAYPKYVHSLRYFQLGEQSQDIMVSLNFLSITRPHVIASSLPNDRPHLPPHPNSLPRTNNSTPPQFHQQEKLKPKQKQRQSSIAEIERAIGAGIFRENDTNRESEGNKNLFDSILTNSVGKDEGSVEKKLRETGEWIIDQTERTSRSSGKQILMTVFLWVLPMWIVAFLVASGILQLPFSTPFLDDIIS
ncbi:probable NAD(P)H dehydrogenase subunit CRR3, chloroplastic [Olea europaea var. sylvestris]|uniref:probable NAD(P)H dehydrogenase subunit CRR3, chloroplastic n=1 Tax=Olea europaea var. sylvestris TaxID=158386 RepID=UPI000C1D788A|nr:probable NAD(P)H dehydrogenase subunit CRR3, chloroplastic [Olea europaea var. sylvestris]